MATFLRLCQDVARECDLAGGETVPTAVTGQTGELQRIVRWVEQEWVDIQGRHNNWRFMRVGFSFGTSASDGSYVSSDATDDLTTSAITNFSRWRVNNSDNPPTCFLTSSGVGSEYFLEYMSWDLFKRYYLTGTQNDQAPRHISVDPQSNLVLGPVPDAAYTISGDYQRSATVLTANGDIPAAPIHYHSVIKWGAMREYGYFESADEIVARAEKKWHDIISQMEAEQLPALIIGYPMA